MKLFNARTLERRRERKNKKLGQKKKLKGQEMVTPVHSTTTKKKTGF